MKFLKILFAIPKTIYVNFRFLSVKEAFKLPIWVTWNTKIEGYGGVALRGKIRTLLFRHHQQLVVTSTSSLDETFSFLGIVL